MKLNENLFEMRRKAGLSQEELADKIGVSRQAVGKWENAAAVPELDKLIALSEVFGVGIGELLGLDAPAAGAAKADTGEIEELLKTYAEEQKTLTKRYESALRAGEERARIRQKRLWLALGAAGIAVAVLGIVLGARINRLDYKLSALQSDTAWQYGALSGDINGMRNSITNILQAQASLFSDYSCDVTDYNAETETLTVTVFAMPKTLTDATTMEFVLTAEESGAEYRTEGARQGLAFTAEIALPSGYYELAAILDEGGTRSQESLGRYSASVLGLEANYRFDWLEGPDYATGTWPDWEGQRCRPQGLLAIWSSRGQWPARAIESAELVLYKNEAEYARVSLETGDPANWYETYDVPEEYLRGPLAYSVSNESKPTGWTAPEDGLLFVAEFDLGEIPVADRDTTRLELVVTDALGLVYRREDMDVRSYRDSGTFSSAAGHSSSGGLSMDYSLYD